MEYIIVILFLLYGIINYDIRYRKNIKFEYTILFFMFFLSAFQYHIGADIFAYEYEYNQGYFINSIQDLYSQSDNRRQPGWVLLIWICNRINDNFIFFKVIQALFVNYSIYRLVKYLRLPIYMSLLMYFLFLYPNLNFNTLRQSFSIAIFAFAIPYLESRKLINYYVCCVCAFMFHNSAFILFIFPLFILIKNIGKRYVYSIVACLIILYFLFSTMNANNLLISFLGNLNLGNNIEELGVSYLENENYQRERGLKVFIHLTIWLIPFVYYIKQKSKQDKNTVLSKPLFLFLYMMSVIFCFLDSFVPIFYRLNLFVVMIYYGYTSYMIIDLIQKKSFVICVLSIILYLLYPLTSYFHKSPISGNRLIDQYYPWHSIFTKQTEKHRELQFNKYKIK